MSQRFSFTKNDICRMTHIEFLRKDTFFFMTKSTKSLMCKDRQNEVIVRIQRID